MYSHQEWVYITTAIYIQATARVTTSQVTPGLEMSIILLPTATLPPQLPTTSIFGLTGQKQDGKTIWDTQAIRDLLLCLPLQPPTYLVFPFAVLQVTMLSLIKLQYLMKDKMNKAASQLWCW